MYTLVLGENNAADQTKMMQDQMSGAALSMPDDLNKAFKVSYKSSFISDQLVTILTNQAHHYLILKAEGDILKVTEHHWLIKDIEQKLF